jgi:hypothetical protein
MCIYPDASGSRIKDAVWLFNINIAGMHSTSLGTLHRYRRTCTQAHVLHNIHDARYEKQ